MTVRVLAAGSKRGGVGTPIAFEQHPCAGIPTLFPMQINRALYYLKSHNRLAIIDSIGEGIPVQFSPPVYVKRS
jgi:hypothetical protein